MDELSKWLALAFFFFGYTAALSVIVFIWLPEPSIAKFAATCAVLAGVSGFTFRVFVE